MPRGKKYKGEEELDSRMDFRVNGAAKELFNERCEAMSISPQIFMRDLVKAFNENRLKIEVPKEMIDAQKGLYHAN